MTPEAALDALAGRAEPGRARQMEAYHKIARPYLGTPLPAILVRDARARPGAPARPAKCPDPRGPETWNPKPPKPPRPCSPI